MCTYINPSKYFRDSNYRLYTIFSFTIINSQIYHTRSAAKLVLNQFSRSRCASRNCILPLKFLRPCMKLRITL